MPRSPATPSPCTAAVSVSEFGLGCAPRGEPVGAEAGWRWHTSRTGSWLRPFTTAADTAAAAAAMGRAASGPGQIRVVVDPDDSAEFARVVGAACRRVGRFVVHTSPKQYRAWRLQAEVLGALGKHWDRAAQGGDATVAQMARAWLRAERARDLIVLRAHHIAGPALSWLLSLPAQEGLRVWLISPRPLPKVADVEGVVVSRVSSDGASPGVGSDHPVGCGCEDLNGLALTVASCESATAGLTVATARGLRRLYDIEAAALATATVLLGRPAPDVLATARVRVAGDARTVATVWGTTLVVPEYAQALVRGWAGRWLVPKEWACDVAATYLTLRLEAAERHTGVRLIDPALPPLPLVAWHERSDPGAARLAWLTRSHWLCRRVP